LELEEGNSTLRKLNRSREVYKFWVDAFGDKGIKNYIINGVIETINDRANHYLSTLSEGYMEVKIDTISILKTGDVRDKISISTTVNGVEKSFERCSGGERRLVDLAMMFSLQEVASMNGRKSIDLFFADEAFDWLDDAWTQNAVEVLHELASKGDSVYVITHNDSMKYMFDNCVEIVKTGNKSEVING
jgi:DNA repair exonuclease SbcCD ATPase subunit